MKYNRCQHIRGKGLLGHYLDETRQNQIESCMSTQTFLLLRETNDEQLEVL